MHRASERTPVLKPSAEANEALIELQRIAMRGINQPGSLTTDEVSKMCRLAYVKLAERSPKG